MSKSFVPDFDPSKLRELRKSRNITQAQLAQMVNMSQFLISRIEAGKRKVTYDELEKIARALDVEPSYFLSSSQILSEKNLTDLLNKLSSDDIKILLKRKKAKGFSGLRKKDLVKKVLEIYESSREELYKEASNIYRSKIIERIKDGLDHFFNGRVEILYADDDIVKADVNGHSVVLYLGKDNFEYKCDDSCQDYVYNVKKGRIPFCKHYIAAVASLVYEGRIRPDEVPLLDSEGIELLSKAVERRKRIEGSDQASREIENVLQHAKEYYIEISRQNEALSRKVFKDSAEKVFEEFTLKLFDLLEFETISNRSPHGWDGIIIGIHSTPPFIVVLECKTSRNGIYDYIVKHQEYLLTLKLYAIDLVRNRLFGAFRNYVKYVAIVAPSFPSEAEMLKYSFQNITGLQLSLIPADVLLYLVERYRTQPIVTHSWMEELFREGGIWTKERIDKLFEKSERMIENLSAKVIDRVIGWMRQYVSVKSDAAFINFDIPMFEELSREFFQALSPELVVMGKREVTGIETVRLRHDYYAIWERVLKDVGKALISYLKELSDTQERTTEMKAEIIRQLRLQ